MRLILVLLLVALALSKGTTFAELQEKLIETVTSPFVNLMFVYDSAADSTPCVI
jgi:hypothetical protein